jgi:hypothetical protein
MMSTLARVITGFVLACLTAGLVQVLFVITPAQLLGAPSEVFPQRAGEVGVLALLASTHSAIFASAFALIAVVIGEYMRIRLLPYYLLAGTMIAVLGFVAQYASEVAGQPTIFNTYAMMAFLTSGFCAGLVYWLVAGRGGHSTRGSSRHVDTSGVPTPKSWKNRPRIVVEDSPKSPAGKPVKKPTLSEMLAEADAAVAAKPAPADAKPAAPGKPEPQAGADAKPAPAATSVPSTKLVLTPSETPAKKT